MNKTEQIKPQHYTSSGIYEPIKIIQALGLGFSEGNILKYLLRAGKKTENPTEDMKKIQTYAQFVIDEYRDKMLYPKGTEEAIKPPKYNYWEEQQKLNKNPALLSSCTDFKEESIPASNSGYTIFKEAVEDFLNNDRDKYEIYDKGLLKELVDFSEKGQYIKKDPLASAKEEAVKSSYHLKNDERLPKIVIKKHNTLDQFEDEFLVEGVNELVDRCYTASKDAGWHDNPRPVPTMLMLIVSELSEAMEGDRKGLKDNHLPQYSMLAAELADATIRIADLAGSLNIPLGEVIMAKLQYNKTRLDHKRENRSKEGGKKY